MPATAAFACCSTASRCARRPRRCWSCRPQALAEAIAAEWRDGAGQGRDQRLASAADAARRHRPRSRDRPARAGDRRYGEVRRLRHAVLSRAPTRRAWCSASTRPGSRCSTGRRSAMARGSSWPRARRSSPSRPTRVARAARGGGRAWRPRPVGALQSHAHCGLAGDRARGRRGPSCRRTRHLPRRSSTSSIRSSAGARIRSLDLAARGHPARHRGRRALPRAAGATHD